MRFKYFQESLSMYQESSLIGMNRILVKDFLGNLTNHYHTNKDEINVHILDMGHFLL